MSHLHLWQVICLFCVASYSHNTDLFNHMVQIHGFDFVKLKQVQFFVDGVFPHIDSIKVFLINIFGSRQESPVVVFFVFSIIRTMGCFSLGYIRVNDSLAGLKHHKGARNKRKATVKIRRNPLLRILTLIHIFLC